MAKKTQIRWKGVKLTLKTVEVLKNDERPKVGQ